MVRTRGPPAQVALSLPVVRSEAPAVEARALSIDESIRSPGFVLAAELGRLARKIDAADAERRLVDLYQAGLIELPELQIKRATLTEERATLAHGNQLRHRMHDFAERIEAAPMHEVRFASESLTRPYPRGTIAISKGGECGFTQRLPTSH